MMHGGNLKLVVTAIRRSLVSA